MIQMDILLILFVLRPMEMYNLYTIEGNSGDMCKRNSYPIGYYEIYGYGVPAY